MQYWLFKHSLCLSIYLYNICTLSYMPIPTLSSIYLHYISRIGTRSITHTLPNYRTIKKSTYFFDPCNSLMYPNIPRYTHTLHHTCFVNYLWINQPISLTHVHSLMYPNIPRYTHTLHYICSVNYLWINQPISLTHVHSLICPNNYILYPSHFVPIQTFISKPMECPHSMVKMLKWCPPRPPLFQIGRPKSERLFLMIVTRFHEKSPLWQKFKSLWQFLVFGKLLSHL